MEVRKLMNQKVLAQIIRGDHLVENPKNVLTGQIRGYFATIDFREQGFFTLRMNAKAPEQLMQPIDLLFEQMKSQNKKIVTCRVFDSVVEVKASVTNRGKKLPEMVNWVVDCVTYYLQQNAFMTGCAMCGRNDVPVALANINENMVFCCDNCFAEKQELLSQHQQAFKQKSGNMVTGIVGGLLGALIGVVVWVIIFKLGYVAAISGLIMVVCVMKGYELLGGKLNVLGAIITIILSLAMIYFAERVALSMEISKALSTLGDVSFWDAFKNFNSIIDSVDGWGEVGHDLAYGFICTLVGGISIVHNAYKQKAGKLTIKRM